jgi:hypothetical protein
MWVPRWLRKLHEALRSESSAIQDALKQQANAISVNSKSCKDEQREFAGIVARAIDKAASEVSGSEQAQRDKEYRLQIALVLLTFLAAGGAIAAAIGSWFALPQVKKSADAAKSAADTADAEFKISSRAWMNAVLSNPGWRNGRAPNSRRRGLQQYG